MLAQLAFRGRRILHEASWNAPRGAFLCCRPFADAYSSDQQSEEEEESEPTMWDGVVKVPGSSWPIDEKFYEPQLDAKLKLLKDVFNDMELPEIEVFRSKPLNFRHRCDFKIARRGGYCYTMNDAINKKSVKFTQFPIGSLLINQMMALLLEGLLKHRKYMGSNLFAMRFHSTLSGEGSLTLLYRKPIEEKWLPTAVTMRTEFAAAGCNVNIIGRSRKQLMVAGKPYLDEVLEVKGQRIIQRQFDSEFSQPNAEVNQQMLGWASDVAKDLKLADADLAELYCGNGNFTIPLAPHFRRVYATELSKGGIQAARHNVFTAGVTNVTLTSMKSMAFARALRNSFHPNPLLRKDPLNLGFYNFQTIVLDPPRCGADPGTLLAIPLIPNVIYISCSPTTLHDNLQTLRRTHRIRRFAAFDQFPYSDHLECGVLLGPK